MRYRSSYKYERRFGNPHHVWMVIGAHGAIHLHITDYGEDCPQKHLGRPQYDGGIEIHHRSPPPYMEDFAPSHDACWLLHCPCWHDGSSLQVTEFWVPFWRSAPDDHDRMLTALEGKATEQFTPEEEDE